MDDKLTVAFVHCDCGADTECMGWEESWDVTLLFSGHERRVEVAAVLPAIGETVCPYRVVASLL